MKIKMLNVDQIKFHGKHWSLGQVSIVSNVTATNAPGVCLSDSLNISAVFAPTLANEPHKLKASNIDLKRLMQMFDSRIFMSLYMALSQLSNEM